MAKMNYNSTRNRYINPTIDIQKKNTVFLSLESILPFGKHKGKKVIDVINQYLAYILWAKKEHVFLFDKTVLLFIKEKRDESAKKLNIVYRPREFIPYVKVEKKASCKTVYVFDENYKQIMTFESVIKAAEYFQLSKSMVSYHIKRLKRVKEKYFLSYSEYPLFID